MEYQMIPPSERIDIFVEHTPDYMHPTHLPHAVVLEGALEDHICDELIETSMKEEPYKFGGCGGETRQIRPLPEIFDEIVDRARQVNSLFWRFNLDREHAAWFQTYRAGDIYQIHADSSLGQSRKLTAVALLSRPEDYSGGELRIVPYPEGYRIPKTRGTICIFPAWMLHEVLPVSGGLRQTLNVGFWGPPFK